MPFAPEAAWPGTGRVLGGGTCVRGVLRNVVVSRESERRASTHEKAIKISLEGSKGFPIFTLVGQGFPVLCGLAELVMGNSNY